MFCRLARERERFTFPRDARGRAAVHVEVAFDFAPLFREQHRKKEAGAEPPSEHREQAGARGWAMRSQPMAVLGQQLLPHLHVPVFDVGEAKVQGLLVRVRFRGRQDTIQKGGVGFVLPMVFEGVQVRQQCGRGHG